MLCDASDPIKVGRAFDAQLVILEHKSIICAGYSAVMHIHCAAEEVTVNVSIFQLATKISQNGVGLIFDLLICLFVVYFCRPYFA